MDSPSVLQDNLNPRQTRGAAVPGRRLNLEDILNLEETVERARALLEHTAASVSSYAADEPQGANFLKSLTEDWEGMLFPRETGTNY